MASFASSAITGGARKHAWTKTEKLLNWCLSKIKVELRIFIPNAEQLSVYNL